MEGGSSSKTLEKANVHKGRPKPGSWPPKVEPFVPRTDHNPRELISWAKRTGFNPNFSGETASSVSERHPNEKNDCAGFDVEKGLDGRGGSSPKIEIDLILGSTRGSRAAEIEPLSGPGIGRKHENDSGNRLRNEPERVETQKRRDEPIVGLKYDAKKVDLNGNGNADGSGQEAPAIPPTAEPKKDDGKTDREVEIDVSTDTPETSLWGRSIPSGIKCGLRENPGPGWCTICMILLVLI